jgi:hypothetical protein
MSRFLLHPKATLMLIGGGCTAIAIQVTAIVSSLGNLNSIPAVAKYVAPTTAILTTTTVVLGAVAAICIMLAGIGRSPMSDVDSPTSSVQITTPPDSTTTVTTTEKKDA